MIDFHTHIFPDAIAANTISFLITKCQTTPTFDGTKDGLLASAAEASVDCSVILPVVTNPTQFDSIHQFATQFQEAPLISFGGIHPDSEHYKEELNTIKELGFKGIKLHPDYQGVFINDLRYKRIISYASELDLIISVHAGSDPGFPDCVHCTPKLAREMFDDVRPEKLVLAHLGGFLRWNEVEEYLVGQPIFFDTAVIFGFIPDEQFIRIVQNHGVEKILFGSDAPWGRQSGYVTHLKNLPLSSEDKQLIFHDNAAALLGLRGEA